LSGNDSQIAIVSARLGRRCGLPATAPHRTQRYIYLSSRKKLIAAIERYIAEDLDFNRLHYIVTTSLCKSKPNGGRDGSGAAQLQAAALGDCVPYSSGIE
jgi:hypothetical protein